MNLQVIGCSHRVTPIALRERLAFGPDETAEALSRWRSEFPRVEAVLLSTCNRTEIYAGAENGDLPSRGLVVGFLARFHGLDPAEVDPHFYQYENGEAVKHLFTVACSLDSMVVGEPQILAQVKNAYQAATGQDNAGPLTHAAFQAALKVAHRVAAETAIHQRRVSIPSIAVADFAAQIFERFDDKHVVVIGAGEMAEETLRYLKDEGAHQITVVNRHIDRGAQLAARWHGRAIPWEQLVEALATADLVVSTTGAGRPIVTREEFGRVERARIPRPLFILDLAVPRDFDAAIGQRPDVYLYSIDDLQAACEANRARRDKELPKAMRIVEEETARFMADLHHRASRPIIEQLRGRWQEPKDEEVRRLLNKLSHLSEKDQEEIRRSFDRLVNKLLHPPMESLRDESRHGIPHVLHEALSRLFRLKD
jgi:glutamyl-tRNA reductase